MRTTVRATLAAGGLVAIIGTAIAADMTGDEIKATISGKTVYLECGATSTGGQGQGVIYFGAAGGLHRLERGAQQSVQQIRQAGGNDHPDQRRN